MIRPKANELKINQRNRNLKLAKQLQLLNRVWHLKEPHIKNKRSKLLLRILLRSKVTRLREIRINPRLSQKIKRILMQTKIMIYLRITPAQQSLPQVDLGLSNLMLAVLQIITLSKFQLKLTTLSHNIQSHSMKISSNNLFIQNNSQ